MSPTTIPVSLQTWINGASKPAQEQAMFVRDEVLSVLGAGLGHEERDACATVIGQHKSKSVMLPVYELLRSDLGLRLVMRCNFYDWKLSVDSKVAIRDRSGVLGALFHVTPPVEPEFTGDDLICCYFEGFSREDVFRYHSMDPHRWSASIPHDYALWMTVFHIMHEVGGVRPLMWHTKASHAAELDARRAKRPVQRVP